MQGDYPKGFFPNISVIVRTEVKRSSEYGGDAGYAFIEAIKHLPRRKQIEIKTLLATKWRKYSKDAK